MVDFNINVVVNTRGVNRGIQQTQRQLNNLNRSAQRTGQLIRRAFAFAGVGIGVQQLTRLADTYTNVQNRIRTVLGPTQDLAAIQGELFNVAQRSRVPLETVATLYQRTTNATRALGISTSETIDFIESLTQAATISGASTIETANALRQLTQGLSAGALRGEEFNAINEQLPEILAVVRDELGITDGALRELAFSGGLTAELLVDSFRNAADQIQEDFDRLPATISQALVQLSNSFVTLIGRINETLGVSTGLIAGLQLLANNLGLVAFAVAGVATVFVVRLIPAMLATAGTAVANLIGSLLSLVATLNAARIATATYASVSLALIILQISRLDVLLVSAVQRLFVFFTTLTTGQIVSTVAGAIGRLSAALIFMNGILLTAVARFRLFIVSVAAAAVSLFRFVAGLRLTVVASAASAGVARLSAALAALRGVVLLLQRAFVTLTITILTNPLLLAATAVAIGAVVLAVRAVGLSLGELIRRIRETGFAFDGLLSTLDSLTGGIFDLSGAAENARGSLDAVGQSNNAFAASASAAAAAAMQQAGALNDVASAAQNAATATNAANAAAARGAGGGGGGGGGRVIVQRQSPELALQNDFLRVFGSIPPAFRSGDLSLEEAQALFNRRLQSRIRAGERAGRLEPRRFGRNTGRLSDRENNIPGFQRGGSFTVEGRGGVDRNVLSLNGTPVARVTRGEDVNIQPRGQQTPQVNITVVADDADSFRRSQPQILSRMQAALARQSGRNN